MSKHSVAACILISICFLLITTSLYPGGSLFDKASKGFDWSRNFFSNLFLENALNGAPNPARPWALIGIAFHSVGYALFFLHTSRKIPHRHSQQVLKTVAVINMIFVFLIATRLHDIMVTLSSTLTMLGLFYITVFVFRTRLHWLKVFCAGSLLLFYATLFLYGTGYWGWLAIMQKVSFFCFILLVLAIEYGTGAKDFQVMQPSHIPANAQTR